MIVSGQYFTYLFVLDRFKLGRMQKNWKTSFFELLKLYSVTASVRNVLWKPEIIKNYQRPSKNNHQQLLSCIFVSKF
jgi:hypothetical protein